MGVEESYRKARTRKDRSMDIMLKLDRSGKFFCVVTQHIDVKQQ